MTYSRGLLLGLVIGLALAFAFNTYAYRPGQPVRFTDLSNTSQVNDLNDVLTKLNYVIEGKYNANVVTTAPTSTTATEGDFMFSNVSGTYKLHAFINGGWREEELD